MPIKGRRSVPDPTVQAEYREERREEARSPFLQGQRLEVYQFISDNVDCTREDVARGLGMKSSTATARIKELIDEGFIIEPPGIRKLNRSGVNAKVLRISDRPMGGRALDRVRVEVTLTIDYKGRYGATARVIGGDVRRPGIPILRKRITLTAPHPDTYKSAFIDDDVTEVSRSELRAHADEIIDTDYTVIEDD